MNVLITGGTGFIGSRLTLKCLEKGYRVKVLGQENTPAESENRKVIEARGAEVILASVTETKSLFDHLKDTDVVFHLAATQHEMNVPDQKFWDVNVGGTQNMLAASLHNGIKRFVHGSTIGVYGALEGTLDEESPCHPDNIYGVTKLEGERLVLSYSDKLPVVAIRISEVYGPGDHRLLKLFKTINKNVFFMIGNGKNVHHLIYVDDLIDGFLLAATNDQASGEVFTLAGKEPVTTNQMVQVIAEELGTTMPKLRVPLLPMLVLATIIESVLRPLGIQPPIHRRRMDFFKKSFSFSQQKAASMLGFVPKTSFRQGVFETAKWYKEMGYLAKTEKLQSPTLKMQEK